MEPPSFLELVCFTGETEIFSPLTKQVYVMKGDNVTLRCRQKNCLDVVWYRDTTTKLDSKFHSGINIIGHREPAKNDQPCVTYSNLTLTNIKDSNMYSCRVQQGEDAYYVTVYVIESEHEALMNLACLARRLCSSE